MGSWGHGLLGSDLGSWGQTWEAVQEFPLEIHKSLPSNGLRISSLIKVVSLLARTYGKKRRILGQPPRMFFSFFGFSVSAKSSRSREFKSSPALDRPRFRVKTMILPSCFRNPSASSSFGQGKSTSDVSSGSPSTFHQVPGWPSSHSASFREDITT